MSNYPLDHPSNKIATPLTSDNKSLSEPSLRMKLRDLPFTRRQKKLIQKYLRFYNQLSSGQRKPTTAAQVHFVEVCNGKYEPHTEHKVTYLVYREACDMQDRRSKKSQRARKPIANQQRSVTQQRPIYKVDPRAPKPWSRYIDEPLGSREDFKRDSARNWSRARRPK